MPDPVAEARMRDRLRLSLDERAELPPPPPPDQPDDEHHHAGSHVDARGRPLPVLPVEVARAHSAMVRAPMPGESHMARGDDAYLEAEEPRTGASSASMGIRSRPGHEPDTSSMTGRGTRVLPDGTVVHTGDDGGVILKETARDHTAHELESARARSVARALRMMTRDDESAETTPDDEAAEGEQTPPAPAPEGDSRRRVMSRALRTLRGEE